MYGFRIYTNMGIPVMSNLIKLFKNTLSLNYTIMCILAVPGVTNAVLANLKGY
jgi:hypothetical protein